MLSERRSGLWAKLRVGWHLVVAIAVVLGLYARRLYLARRAAAHARRAATIFATQRTGEEIERVEYERIRLRHRATQYALKAQEARKRAAEIAERLERGGFGNVGSLVKEWNRE